MKTTHLTYPNNSIQIEIAKNIWLLVVRDVPLCLFWKTEKYYQAVYSSGFVFESSLDAIRTVIGEITFEQAKQFPQKYFDEILENIQPNQLAVSKMMVMMEQINYGY